MNHTISRSSLAASTEFLRDILRETSTICNKQNEPNQNQIPVVELRDASLEEQDLLAMHHRNTDPSTNLFTLMQKELQECHQDAGKAPLDKIDLLLRVYDKVGDTSKTDQLRQMKHQLRQLFSEIDGLRKQIEQQESLSSIPQADIALLREEAELDRLELQISKLRCAPISNK